MNFELDDSISPTNVKVEIEINVMSDASRICWLNGFLCKKLRNLLHVKFLCFLNGQKKEKSYYDQYAFDRLILDVF